MKRILLLTVISASLFFSCQNTTENTTADSSIVVPIAEDSMAPATEEAVNVSQIPEEDQASLDIRDFDYTYEGLINGQIKVKLNIFKYRGEQKARAVYLSAKKIIDMDAEYPAVGTFELTEKINGKPTGIWRVESEEEDILSGTWTSPDGAKKMTVTLSMSTEDFDNFLPKEEVKTGFYEYKEVNEDAESKQEYPHVYLEELYVKNMSGSTLYFDLYIQGPPPGVHMGMINGFASKSGKDYIYKNEEGCQITMSFSDDNVTLTQKGTDFNCEFGANIQAFGTLKRSEP